MKSISRIFAIAKKEILEFRSTPLLLITETIFIALSGYFFYLGLVYYSQLSVEWLANPLLQVNTINPSAMVIPPVFSNYSLLLLFFIPLLTMSAFSNEKRGGTLELLYTLPVKDVELIFGKWLGASVMVFFLFLPLWTFPLVAHLIKLPLSLEAYAAGFIGLLLLAFLFISVGIFVSSLFESQTASAAMTIGLLVILWTIESAGAFEWEFVSKVLSNFSVQKYLQPFLRGVVSTENILFFILAIIFFLFLTFRSLEKRSFRNPL